MNTVRLVSRFIDSTIHQRRHYLSYVKYQHLTRGLSTFGTTQTDGQQHCFDDADQDYLLPVAGHRVYVIQPALQLALNVGTTNYLTTPEMQLDESCSLVHSVAGWKVVDKSIYSLRRRHKKYVYGQGNLETMTREIRQSSATAVFLSINMLTGLQLDSLQKIWKLPVYDRYTLVLQIFKLRAQTREAKLQIALAEIPYYKSRMISLHNSLHNVNSFGDITQIGGAKETHLEQRRELLKDRETKLKKALENIKDQRRLVKKRRVERNIPTIAVVGYTNAGKTSLIKALTGERSMYPMDQLFATLDVSVHGGILANNMKILYVDTVGFISNIPTDLIQCFSATLQDMIEADVIMHVQDVSNPDYELQRVEVEQTLAALQVPEKVLSRVINVYNKCDRLDEWKSSEFSKDADAVLISCVKFTGLDELVKVVEDRVLELMDYQRKIFKLPMNGQQLSWLYKEATVVGTSELSSDSEFLLVEVVISTRQYEKFKTLFGKTRRKSLNINTKT